MLNKLTLLLFTVILTQSCSYIGVNSPLVMGHQKTSKAVVDSSSIRVMVWNIHKEGESPLWREEFSHAVNDVNPNLILLQEVRLAKGLSGFIAAQQRYGWAFSANTYQASYDAYSGVLTASSAPATKLEGLLSNGLEPFSRTPKTTLFTQYDLSYSALKLLVVNIHGINFQITSDEFKEQLHGVSIVIKQHQGPVIMAGDFNSWSQKRLQYLYKSTGELGLSPVNFHDDAAYIKTAFGNPLDHIFYSNKFLKPLEGSEDVFEAAESSDHQALFVEFSLH